MYLALFLVSLHVGTSFHTTTLLGLPKDYQQLNRSTTLLGITLDIPKQLKKTPNGGSHITMKKKMIHQLPISLSHVTFVHHDEVPLPKIIQCEDLA